MKTTIKITKRNWNSITVARNPEFISGASKQPFKVEIIVNGEYLKQLSAHVFQTLDDAIERARFMADQCRINWEFEKGL